jgi:arylsulfatase A-like enzyme
MISPAARWNQRRTNWIKSIRQAPRALTALLVIIGGGCDKFSSSKSNVGESSPSVYIIVMDALSAEYMGCYGDTTDASPNVDRFAQESVLFESAYSQSASTVPSTASLMTGTRATTHRLSSRTKLRRDLPTMAEILSDAGFKRSGFIGNPHAGAAALGLDRGFDPCVQVYALPKLQETRPLEETSNFRVAWPGDINEQVIAALPGFKKKGQFAYIHYLQPHKPYDPPAKYVERFDPDKAGACKCGGQSWMKLHEKFVEANRTGHVSSTDLAHLMAQYRATLSYVDQAFGELVRELKKAGLYDDALIILSSDHGDAFFDHHRFGHNVHLYDDMVRIPLIVKFPRSDEIKPRRLRSLVETVDVMPTVLDFLNLDPPDELEGESLLPLMMGVTDKLENPEVVMSTHDLRKHAIRLGDYKFIFSSEEDQELYNLIKDPREQDNLFAKDKEKSALLRKRLEQIIDLTTGSTQEEPSDLRTDERMDSLLKTLGYVEGEESSAISEPTSQPAG